MFFPERTIQVSTLVFINSKNNTWNTLVPQPEEPSILSFILLERFYKSQQPQLQLPTSYKHEQTAAYVASLPPTYDEIDLNSPPPAYKITDLEDIPEEDETRTQNP